MSDIPKYLTSKEARRLRQAVSEKGKKRDIAIIELMLRYGPRASEIGLLRLDNINIEEDTIQMPRLKGGRENIWPLFQSVKDSLEKWLEERESPTSWVFPGYDFKGLSRKTIWTMMQKYGDIAEIPKDKRHPHTCRHFAAVNALEAGLDIHDVQDLLGHKAISSTMVYAQITNKQRVRAAKALEKFNS